MRRVRPLLAVVFATALAGVALADGPSAPPNDRFAGRASIDGPTFAGTTAGATSERGEPRNLGSSADPRSVWFAWTAPETRAYTVSLCRPPTDYDTTLGVYADAKQVSSIKTAVGSNDNSSACGAASAVTFAARSGARYAISVAGAGSATGRFGGSITTASSTTTIAGPEGLEPTAARDAAFRFAADGAAGYECSLDGGAFAACASGQALSGLGEGAHVFEVRAVKGGGAEATAASRWWTTDYTPPDTGLEDRGGAVFGLGATEGRSTFECSVDGAAFVPCDANGAVDLSRLCAGPHTLRARAMDAAGNRDPVPAERAFSVAGTTACGAPGVMTLATGPVTADSAQLKGLLSPRGRGITYFFEYGPTTSYGATTQHAASWTAADHAVSELVDLPAGTTVHYRLVAVDGAGRSSVGSDQTATTAAATPGTPRATTGDAVLQDDATARLHATVDAGSGGGTLRFLVKAGDDRWRATPPADVPAGGGERTIAATVTGLAAGATHEYYAWVATDSGGHAYGLPRSFATQSTASAAPPPAARPVPATVKKARRRPQPRLTDLLRRRFVATARCARPCRVTGALLVEGKQARVLAAGRRKPVRRMTIASARGERRRPGTTRLRFVVRSPQLKGRLARRRTSLRATLVIRTTYPKSRAQRGRAARPAKTSTTRRVVTFVR